VVSSGQLFTGFTDNDADPLELMLEQIAERAEGLKGDHKAAYDNLEYYSRYVIGHGDSDYSANARLHKTIYNAFQYSEDDLLILAPRGSGKSQSVSITATTWEIGRNPLLRFLISFASMEAQGKPFARQMDAIFTKNERYIEIFGQLKPDIPIKWDASEKIVARPEPPGGMKDATITLVGLGSAVPSKRSDRIIGDDLVTGDNAYSKLQQDRVESFWQTTLFPTLVPTGRQIIIGTLWSLNDFYHRIAASWGHEFPKPLVMDTDKLNLQRKLLEIAA